MKLELKHIAPYLPYGLKIRIGTSEHGYDLTMSSEDEMDGEYISIRDIIENKHTPILRPLSDLAKHCEDLGFVKGSGVTIRRELPKVNRNEKCPCGSGKKYKQCCLIQTHKPKTT